MRNLSTEKRTSRGGENHANAEHNASGEEHGKVGRASLETSTKDKNKRAKDDSPSTTEVITDVGHNRETHDRTQTHRRTEEAQSLLCGMVEVVLPERK